MPLNVEFKARCRKPQHVRAVLRDMRAELAGVDHQTDTYFNVPSGRLKLRDGNVERNLIYYRREDGESPKPSEVSLAPCPDPRPLLSLLSSALGIRCVVRKRREIYFYGNAKIHVDEVPGLGEFVEVEVIAEHDEADREAMHRSCHEWMGRLDVDAEDLVASSYSDMIMSA